MKKQTMELRDRIMVELAHNQWVNPKELVDSLQTKKGTLTSSMNYLEKRGQLQGRYVETEDSKGRPLTVKEYRIPPANIFNPDEFADYYRDPIKSGMSLNRKYHGF